MANYTANVYGAGDSRKGGWKSSAGVVNEISTMGKSAQFYRLVVAAGTEIIGGEIFINKGTTLTAGGTDTITLTLQTG